MKNARTIKRCAIVAAVVAYIGIATVGTLYGSAALFQLFSKQAVHDLTISSTFDLWDKTEPGSKERKKMKGAIGLPVFAFLGVPIFVASLGRKERPLHGAARFATRAEIQKAGLLG